MISCAAVLAPSSAWMPLCWRFCVWSCLPLWMCIMCLSLSCLSGRTHWVSVLAAWTWTSAPRCRLLSRWRPLKQLPPSFTVLAVFPTTRAVISQVIGVTVGVSGAEKGMCQTGHQFPAEHSVPLHQRSNLQRFPGCEEVPPDQAFIFWGMSCTCISAVSQCWEGIYSKFWCIHALVVKNKGCFTSQLEITGRYRSTSWMNLLVILF